MSTQNAGKLSFTEKFGYSLADGAAQFVFLTMVNFQAGFYTDAVGIRAADASWLVLLARLWDAFFDPMMGFLADRTQTRWGRFRPWILWSIIPWAAVHGAGLHRASVADVLGHLCLRARDEHRPDDRVFDEQHALLGPDGRNDRRPKRAHRSSRSTALSRR